MDVITALPARPGISATVKMKSSIQQTLLFFQFLRLVANKSVDRNCKLRKALAQMSRQSN